MDKALLFFGSIIVIFGLAIFYLMITSVINLAQSIKEEQASIPEVERNKINFSALISAMIVLIGVLITRKGMKS